MKIEKFTKELERFNLAYFRVFVTFISIIAFTFSSLALVLILQDKGLSISGMMVYFNFIIWMSKFALALAILTLITYIINYKKNKKKK